MAEDERCGLDTIWMSRSGLFVKGLVPGVVLLGGGGAR